MEDLEAASPLEPELDEDFEACPLPLISLVFNLA